MAQRSVLCWNTLISLIKDRVQMMNFLEYKQSFSVRLHFSRTSGTGSGGSAVYNVCPTGNSSRGLPFTVLCSCFF